MKHARADYDRIQDPKNKIGKDEPVFLFRAQDRRMIRVLRYYANTFPDNDPVRLSVEAHIETVKAWQASHPTKDADL